jgi:hypothetical protein
LNPERLRGIQNSAVAHAAPFCVCYSDSARDFFAFIEREFTMSSLVPLRDMPRRVRVVLCCLSLVAATQLVGAGKAPIKNLTFDPTAEKAEMFTAVESGILSVRVVAHNPEGGKMYFKNLSGKPLTVILPEAVTIVHVLKQFGGGGMGGFGGGGMGGGQQGGFGGGQSGGGGFGGGGMGGGGFGGGGMGGGGFGGGGGAGFFSIPPDRVAQVPYHSVCLNHGKQDPSPAMTYVAVPIEKYTDNKILQETIRMIGTGRLDYSVAQAAAWHITDNMSWEELGNLRANEIEGIESYADPVFSTDQLQSAQQLVVEAAKRIDERAKNEPAAKPTEVKPQTSKQKTNSKPHWAQ